MGFLDFNQPTPQNQSYPSVLEKSGYTYGQALSPADAAGLKQIAALAEEAAKATEEGSASLGDLEQSNARIKKAWATNYAPKRGAAEVTYHEAQASLAATRAVFGHRANQARRKPQVLAGLLQALFPHR